MHQHECRSNASVAPAHLLARTISGVTRGLKLTAVLTTLVLRAGQSPAYAATRTVGPGGPPTYTYGTIAAGLASITPNNDTILVYPGTYHEHVSSTTTGAGSDGHLGVLKAIGTVKIDGRATPSPPLAWTQYSGNVYSCAFAVGNLSPEQYQLFDGDLRYTYLPSVTNYTTLTTHQNAYDSGTMNRPGFSGELVG